MIIKSPLFGPMPANPMSQAQERALISLVVRTGRERYRSYKNELGIPMDVAIPRLSRGQAWRLLNRIINDLNNE